VDRTLLQAACVFAALTGAGAGMIALGTSITAGSGVAFAGTSLVAGGLAAFLNEAFRWERSR
jgi:hypothetical protein